MPHIKKSYVSPKVTLRDSAIEGKALVAVKKIKKGELVVDFRNGPGEFIGARRAAQLFKRGFDYMIQVDEGVFFAATDEKNLESADFVNHSCDPTCGIKGIFRLVARRDIQPGEEITFDYAMSESMPFRISCACGAVACRKIITGNDWKKKELQKKYRGYFSRYLQKKITALRASSYIKKSAHAMYSA